VVGEIPRERTSLLWARLPSPIGYAGRPPLTSHVVSNVAWRTGHLQYLTPTDIGPNMEQVQTLHAILGAMRGSQIAHMNIHVDTMLRT
jgi:predicted metal-dependent RNase